MQLTTQLSSKVYFLRNSARDGIGGGLSVILVHSPHIRNSGDKVTLDNTWYWNNQAASGQALALQSSPKYRKAIFSGVTLRDTQFIFFHRKAFGLLLVHENVLSELATFQNHRREHRRLTNKTMPEIMRLVYTDPFLQVQVNTSMILLLSVKVKIGRLLTCHCGATSQGIQAMDSEIIMLPNA